MPDEIKPEENSSARKPHVATYVLARTENAGMLTSGTLHHLIIFVPEDRQMSARYSFTLTRQEWALLDYPGRIQVTVNEPKVVPE